MESRIHEFCAELLVPPLPPVVFIQWIVTPLYIGARHTSKKINTSQVFYRYLISFSSSHVYVPCNLVAENKHKGTSDANIDLLSGLNTYVGVQSSWHSSEGSLKQKNLIEILYYLRTLRKIFHQYFKTLMMTGYTLSIQNLN